MSGAANYDLKEEIRAYWTDRAETFDRSAGHRIRSDAELAEWVALLRAHTSLGPDSRVLELASGTGEMTRVLLALGCQVEGIDLTEAMIQRARAKHAGQTARFDLGDAEHLRTPPAQYDGVVCRHLVWTLTAPDTTFRGWLAALKPGARLVVIDGDWVRGRVGAWLLLRIAALWDRLRRAAPLWDQAAHERIMQRVFFRDGLRAETLVAMLRDAGFTEIRVGDLARVRRQQLCAATWRERLTLLAAYDHSFIVSAQRPA